MGTFFAYSKYRFRLPGYEELFCKYQNQLHSPYTGKSPFIHRIFTLKTMVS